MKRTHWLRLQDSDVFFAPKSLGLKALKQNSIMCVGLELNGLHPLSCRYAQATIGETMVFTDWVQKVLKVNGELPSRSSWSRSAKSWEIELKALGGQGPMRCLHAYSVPETPYRGATSDHLFAGESSCELPHDKL